MLDRNEDREFYNRIEELRKLTYDLSSQLFPDFDKGITERFWYTKEQINQILNYLHQYIKLLNEIKYNDNYDNCKI